jgi:hypothetical protein
VCFPGSRPADNDEIVGRIEKRQLVQLADRCFVDLRFGKIKSAQITVRRYSGRGHPVCHGPDFAFSAFRAQQLHHELLWIEVRQAHLPPEVQASIAPCRAVSSLSGGG